MEQLMTVETLQKYGELYKILLVTSGNKPHPPCPFCCPAWICLLSPPQLLLDYSGQDCEWNSLPLTPGREKEGGGGDGNLKGKWEEAKREGREGGEVEERWEFEREREGERFEVVIYNYTWEKNWHCWGIVNSSWTMGHPERSSKLLWLPPKDNHCVSHIPSLCSCKVCTTLYSSLQEVGGQKCCFDV